MKAWRAYVWRRKKAAWRRARCPEVWSPRARLEIAGALVWIAVWKYAWLLPLLALHRSGVLSWEDYEHAATAPFKRRG